MKMVVKALVTVLEGTITVESEVGKVIWVCNRICKVLF
ncbi:hypothetical protein Clo1100_1897 [Clostridium sp. BNL1100]|nr:hypothetical protein Clo1100_1897 [Clostridium sp. BNL1100]